MDPARAVFCRTEIWIWSLTRTRFSSVASYVPLPELSATSKISCPVDVPAHPPPHPTPPSSHLNQKLFVTRAALSVYVVPLPVKPVVKVFRKTFRRVILLFPPLATAWL